MPESSTPPSPNALLEKRHIAGTQKERKQNYNFSAEIKNSKTISRSDRTKKKEKKPPEKPKNSRALAGWIRCDVAFLQASINSIRNVLRDQGPEFRDVFPFEREPVPDRRLHHGLI